jgi:hypothetical protein
MEILMIASKNGKKDVLTLTELCMKNDCRLEKDHSGRCNKFPKKPWDFLSKKDLNKIIKAGYATPRGGYKGAYQNHVIRNNKVIIPYNRLDRVNLSSFKDGYVICLSPGDYFESKNKVKPEFLPPDAKITVGVNAFILYRSQETRTKYPPLNGWAPRTLEDKNEKPIPTRKKGCIDKGEYVIRLPEVTDEKNEDVGAPQGIFAPEYADAETNYLCQALLAWLIIHCEGRERNEAQELHLKAILNHAQSKYPELGEANFLSRRGIINNGLTTCPLCTRPIKYTDLHKTISFADVPGLENAGLQTEGTTKATVVNLFHIEPLLYKSLTHLPINVAWGHATCNTILAQRHCYSLTELQGQGRQVAVFENSTTRTLGWVSSDDQMIRSDNGSVWVRLVTDVPDEDKLMEELTSALEGTTNASEK